MPASSPDPRVSTAQKLLSAGCWLAKGLQYSPGMAGILFPPVRLP